MQFKDQYEFYIDKTQSLEKGIGLFPSIYIEGAAASGKTTAVKMLLDRHPEVKRIVLTPEEFGDSGHFREMLEELKMQTETEEIWVIFENLPRCIAKEFTSEMIWFVNHLPPKGRVIFVGREKPAEELLELLWKRKMELVPQEELLFTKEEIQKFAEQMKSPLNPEEIYAQTGGWAGCVDMMLRLSLQNQEIRESVKELRDCYEIAFYIKREIIETLSSGEQEMMRRANVCPWLDVELCQSVWGMPQAAEHLEMLERKGLLVHNREKKRWKIAPLFRRNYETLSDDEQKQPENFWEYLGKWYESHGFIKEALGCLGKMSDKRKHQKCMRAHFYKIPFSEYSYSEVMSWKDNSPECCYLRGMYCYSQQDFAGVTKELQKLDPARGQQEKEIFLNLSYVNIELTLDGWLELLEKYTEDKKNIRLYHILGNAHTYLCGLRDLSGLFACTKKEENRKAKLWKERLGEEEWLAYRMARMDYYLETERKEYISEEDWTLLEEDDRPSEWQFRLVKLYLYCKLQAVEPSEEKVERIRQLEKALLREESTVCLRNTEALSALYSSRWKEIEKLTRWLRYSDMGAKENVTEENYVMFLCQAKGYLLLNQYEKAEKIFRHLVPYFQTYKRFRFSAELSFQQAIVSWKRKSHSLALKYAIESFLVNGSARYVLFYTGYGKAGMEVLEAYVEWLKNHSPEGWHRKKKYNYGNVLRMPLADYMEVILRCMKREERQNPTAAEERIEERLTMMETIILQNIGRGMTNAEICEELNLKLPTVKSHIYSLYKKLGVNSRMQAVLKGKEMGVIE